MSGQWSRFVRWLPKLRKSMKRKRPPKNDGRDENERRLIDLHKPEVLLKNIDLDEWGWHSRWILLCIGRKDFVAAHTALDAFIAGSVPGSITLDSSIWMLSQHLPYRLLEALENGGYETLRSLDGATDEELRQCDHCGDKHVLLIREAIEHALEVMIVALDGSLAPADSDGRNIRKV